MSLKNIFIKNRLTYKLYLYYNLYIHHKAHIKRNIYSQWGEDQFIYEFFKNKKKGFYIDIGSFHPIMYSNTCLLFNSGWSGINIDVNQSSIDMFKIVRPKDHNICDAVTYKSEERNLYFDHNFSPLNTINKLHYESFDKGLFFKNLAKKKITTKSFDDIVKKIDNLPQIDFLNIDCEGSDYEILKGINLQFYSPKLICIETHNVNNVKNIEFDKIIELLNKHNYKVIKRFGPSSIFVKS